MTELLIDSGNTRLKWRLVEAESVLSSGDLLNRSFSADAIELALSGSQVDRIYLSGVSGSGIKTDLLRILEKIHPEANVFVAETEPEFEGLTNSYPSPSQMGVDRWLAMIAAHREIGGGFVLVDSGTAITCDVVCSTGEHLGGLIMPGVSSLFGALSNKTAQVGSWSELVWPLSPGKSTKACVEAGVSVLLSGFTALLSEWRSTHGALVITGGDAQKLAAMTEGPCLIRENLVLDGLLIRGRASQSRNSVQ